MDKNEILSTLMKTDPFEMLEPEVLEDISGKVEIRKYGSAAQVMLNPIQ